MPGPGRWLHPLTRRREEADPESRKEPTGDEQWNRCRRGLQNDANAKHDTFDDHRDSTTEVVCDWRGGQRTKKRSRGQQ
jgi:hypothetical protein